MLAIYQLVSPIKLDLQRDAAGCRHRDEYDRVAVWISFKTPKYILQKVAVTWATSCFVLPFRPGACRFWVLPAPPGAARRRDRSHPCRLWRANLELSQGRIQKISRGRGVEEGLLQIGDAYLPQNCKSSRIWTTLFLRGPRTRLRSLCESLHFSAICNQSCKK